jgi:selenocysteine lyase/cysteine desulfurase
MLPCQRDQFDIPRHVAYLNAASWSPLPLATQEAGRVGVARKGQPWLLGNDFAATQHERARNAAAVLIGAYADDVALIPSVSYAAATVGKLVAIAAGSRVLVLQDDHSSPVLEWHSRAKAQGFVVEAVKQPEDGDWTTAMLAAIARPGAAPLALASVSSVHWSDGCLLDLDRIAAALRSVGALFFVDATHGAGITNMNVSRLDPDFLVFPTYKWVLGPYGRAFLYIARRHQDGVPLEQTAAGRRAIAADRSPYMCDTAYTDGARRFDMGERDHFVSLEMASIGMELMASWGQPAIERRLRMLTTRLADGLRNTAVQIPETSLRAPNILSLGFPNGMPAGLIERLATADVHVAARLGRMRISPHVYNDETDVDKFLDVFRTT